MTTPSDSLGKDASALIRAARGGDDVPAAERLRLLESFANSAGAAQRPGAGAAPFRPRRGRAPRLGWAVAALVLTGSLAALAQHQGLFERLGALLGGAPAPAAVPSARSPVVHDSVARPPQPAPVPAQPEHAAEPERAAQPERAAEPERAAPREPVRDPASQNPTGVRLVPPRSTLAPLRHDALDPEELDLIAAARTALAERRYDMARQRAERHAQRFPRGAFSEEREAILALSDCRSQRGTERGERFVKERPGALLAERVRRDCGLDPNLVPGEREPGTH